MTQVHQHLQHLHPLRDEKISSLMKHDSGSLAVRIGPVSMNPNTARLVQAAVFGGRAAECVSAAISEDDDTLSERAYWLSRDAASVALIAEYWS